VISSVWNTKAKKLNYNQINAGLKYKDIQKTPKAGDDVNCFVDPVALRGN